jgi:subtilisin family serine protease
VKPITAGCSPSHPRRLAEEAGQLNPDGTPNTPNVVRDCHRGTCAYYQYLHGTSMASPHATGVAALAVGRWGFRDRPHGGKSLFPNAVERIFASHAH